MAFKSTKNWIRILIFRGKCSNIFEYSLQHCHECEMKKEDRKQIMHLKRIIIIILGYIFTEIGLLKHDVNVNSFFHLQKEF